MTTNNLEEYYSAASAHSYRNVLHLNCSLSLYLYLYLYLSQTHQNTTMAAEAAVSFAVETLGRLLIDKAVFLLSVKEEVKEEVEWVREELKSMQCFLKDAAKKQSDSEMVRNWISDVRKVAHDAEDAIEIFVLQVQSKSPKKRYGCFPNHLYHLNRVGEEIKSIRQRLTNIQERRERYDIQKDEPSTRTKSQEEIETRRRLAYWKPDKQVVGLEEDVKQLLGEAVLEKSEGLSVAAIVGMGGMGKSTLATKIYNHPAITGGFEFCAWVVVSSVFTPEDIMKQILLKLGISDDELKRIMSIDDKLGCQEELKKEVHERLTGKRYFIVLDDVWEAAHWQSLTAAFPDGDKGSRLLLTSRNQVITTHDGYVHNMKPLDDTKSWDLFMKKAFGGNTSIDGCPEELKKVGEEILKRCGGLPLAISVVGGLLAKKTRSKREWEKIRMEMKSHMERSKDLNNISGILELSYQNLAPELKACFLCLAFFKEDTIIKATKLVQIWVAHGLVPREVGGGEEEVRMEEVARDYLNELISRNMVQVKEMAYDVVKGCQVKEMAYDVIKSCQVHDFLRDLSIRKAEEEIDFEVLREESNSHKCSLNKPRHRVIYYDEIRFVYSTNRNQHLRSLFINRDVDQYLTTSGGPSSYWKSFELLRFLDLGMVLFRVLPKGIGELTGLKYLRMTYVGTQSRLPRSWAKLKNLEVLDLPGTFGVAIKIDKVIEKMESLRHLYAIVKSCRVGLGKMRKLRTVHMFRVKNSSSNVWGIQGLSGVSKLGIDLIDSYGPNSSLFTCLSSFPNLFHLTLWGISGLTDLQGLTSLHRVTRLNFFNRFYINESMSFYFPPNLSHLTLSYIYLVEGLMPALEKLPNLLYLKLRTTENYNGMEEITINGGFPKLKVLRLKNIKETWKMEIKESAMPELNQLIISNCPDLDVENVPGRIKSVIIVHHSH